VGKINSSECKGRQGKGANRGPSGYMNMISNKKYDHNGIKNVPRHKCPEWNSGIGLAKKQRKGGRRQLVWEGKI